MHDQSYANPAGYLFIMIGLLLAVYSALVPHFEAGYRLATSVLVAGMLPYIVYGVAVPLVRGALMTITGLTIVIVHSWLVFNQRIVGNADYSDGMIYFLPILIAIAALPPVVIALKKQGMF